MRRGRLSNWICRSILTLAVYSAAGIGLAQTTAPAAPPNPFDLAAWLDAEMAGFEKQPVEICDDATFLRRVHLDLIGRIPTVAEVRDFLADESPDKRRKLVERLIVDESESNKNSPLHAEQLARSWRRMMVPAGSTGAQMAPAFEPWLKQQFTDNIAYDEFAKRLLTTKGETSTGAAAYYQAVGGTPQSYADSFARVFLGVRVGCAQCHDHPFAEWKRTDFWGLATFFSGVQVGGPIAETRVVSLTNEGVTYKPKFLWGAEVAIPENRLPREVLAEWLTSAKNPNFSAAAVNRFWQLLNGRGLIPEVDDLDRCDPADRAVLLDRLGQKFAESGFQSRWLIQGICRSQAYQAVSERGPKTEETRLFGRRPLKILSSDQVFDSLEQALSLSISRGDADSARYNGLRNQLVSRLDEAVSSSPEDYAAGIPQVLLLMNGSLMTQATDLEASRTLRAVVDAPFLDDSEKIETLYLATLTRKPTPHEMESLLAHLKTCEGKSGYSEVFWALLNSPEFILSR